MNEDSGAEERQPDEEPPKGEALHEEEASAIRSLFERPLEIRSLSLSLLVILALCFTIAIAKPVLITIAFAWLLKTALVPAVRLLRRAHLPAGVASAVVLLVICGAIGFGVQALAEPAQKWIEELPGSMERIEQRLGEMEGPLENVAEATERVEEMTADEDEAHPVTVRIAGRTTLKERLFTGARLLMLNLVILVVLVYFMLATDEAFLTKLVEIIPRLHDKKLIVGTMHKIEEHVSRYMLTVTMINIGLAVVMSIALWFWEMPHPVLWGVMAGVFNYVPYLGPTVGAVVVAGVSILSFDSFGHIAGPPITYLVVNGIEGLLVTPAILGRSFSLSPVVILVWLLLWSWIWGMAGALLAVPILAAFKIVCDNVPSMNAIGRLLSR